MVTKQAVILVGGKGTRLGALTATTPKPLMQLDAETVFLDELLFEVARQGFDDILLLAGHLHEQFVSRYHGKTLRGAAVRVIVEDFPAGTGGALAIAAPHLQPSFLFANGDTLFEINLRRLAARLENDPDAIAALALRRVPDAGRYGSVDLSNGRVVAFREKDTTSGPVSGSINGGLGVFRREILSFIEHTPCSIETEVYPKLAASNALVAEEFDGYFIDIGLPDTLAQARADFALRRHRPTAFFDRDGVLNRDSGYTHRPEELEWIPGAVDAIRRANDLGALVVVLTNQAGVAHGYYTVEDVDRFHAAMAAELARSGAHIDAFYFCPHHPEAAVDTWRHPDHPDRKPNPGMIERALAEWPIDRGGSFLVGDRDSDVEAARRAGIPGILFSGDDLLAAIGPELDRIAARRAVPNRG